MDNGLKSLVSPGFNPCRSFFRFTPNALPFGVRRNLVILNPSASSMGCDNTTSDYSLINGTQSTKNPRISDILQYEWLVKTKYRVISWVEVVCSESLNVNSSSPSESKLGEFKEIRFRRCPSVELFECSKTRWLPLLLDEST